MTSHRWEAPTTTGLDLSAQLHDRESKRWEFEKAGTDVIPIINIQMEVKKEESRCRLFRQPECLQSSDVDGVKALKFL